MSEKEKVTVKAVWGSSRRETEGITGTKSKLSDAERRRDGVLGTILDTT